MSAPIAQHVGSGIAKSGSYVAKLNAGGNAPQPLGPLKQLVVQQGDTVRVSAYGLYPTVLRNNFWYSLASFITGLLYPAQGALVGPDPELENGKEAWTPIPLAMITPCATRMIYNTLVGIRVSLVNASDGYETCFIE